MNKFQPIRETYKTYQNLEMNYYFNENNIYKTFKNLYFSKM